MAKKKKTPAKKATAITKGDKTLSHVKNAANSSGSSRRAQVEVWVWVYGEGWETQRVTKPKRR